MARVVIQECGSYDLEPMTAKLNAAADLLGGWDRFVKPHDTVLLKVNLIGPKTSDSAAVTHSEFVRAMVRILKARGCTVWIGDSSGGAIAGVAPTAASMRTAGYEAVAAEEGAEIRNFDREGVFSVTPESGCEKQMYLARPLQEADVVISLPKLKTHSAQVFSGAVKNVFGCVPGLKKAQYHRMAPAPADFGEIICDIHRAAHIRLHIMDGIIAMQGEGPTAGTVYPAHRILMSEDPLALDTVAAAMIGMKVDDVPILATARRRGLGESSLDRIELAGDDQQVPHLDGFQLPRSYGRTGKGNGKALIRVIDFFASRPVISQAKCRKCNTCVDSCPMHAIDRETKLIDYSKCIGCMCCHEMCMFQAVELKSRNPLAGVISGFFRK